MTTSRNDLPNDVRVKVCALLNQRLADASDLFFQAKQAHWNVKGINFRSLHKLFDCVAETAEEYVDEFAERVVQLGGFAEGTVQAAVKASTLEEYPLEALSERQHIDAICDRVAHFGKQVRHAIQACEDLGDLVTCDIFTDAGRDIDKLTWMLEAHLADVKQSQKQVGREAA
jgi:starvation-inducible DNA-binding protein